MDCVFSAYSAHARYYKVNTDTKHIFNEMRSLCLNGSVGALTPWELQNGFGRYDQGYWDEYWEQYADANELDMDGEEDLLSDENGLVNGSHDYMKTEKWLNDFFEDVTEPSEREEYVQYLLEEGIVIEDEKGQIFPAPLDGEILVATPKQQIVLLAEENKVKTHYGKRERKKNKKDKYKNANPWWRDYLYESNRKGLRTAYTPAGIVPWIIETIARADGFGIRVQNRDWWPKEVYIEEANNDHATTVINNSNYGEEVAQITLEPAIYCMQSSKHAQFGTKVPQGVCVMAVQLYPLDDDRVIPAPKKGKRLKTWRRNKK